MGNLGGYQVMISIAKNFGGPLALLLTTLCGGYVVGRAAEAGGMKVSKASKAAMRKKGTPCAPKGKVFKVVSDGDDSIGLKLRPGDEFRVLECDGDSILIEVMNDPDTPYFVSGAFLTKISDFPTEDATEGE